MSIADFSCLVEKESVFFQLFGGTLISSTLENSEDQRLHIQQKFLCSSFFFNKRKYYFLFIG